MSAQSWALITSIRALSEKFWTPQLTHSWLKSFILFEKRNINAEISYSFNRNGTLTQMTASRNRWQISPQIWTQHLIPDAKTLQWIHANLNHKKTHHWKYNIFIFSVFLTRVTTLYNNKAVQRIIFSCGEKSIYMYLVTKFGMFSDYVRALSTLNYIFVQSISYIQYT